MAALKRRLRRELGNWRERLPSAWRARFAATSLAFDDVSGEPQIRPSEPIWPQRANPGAPYGAALFKALGDLRPDAVRVVVVGNDPYTRIGQATGRSFEQGDVTSWKQLAQAGKGGPPVSPSFQTLVAAAVATGDAGLAAGYQLADPRMRYDDLEPWGRGQVFYAHVGLSRAQRDGRVTLPRPRYLFGRWARQGVLWMNTTLTYSRWADDHRAAHRVLWAPFTARLLDVLVGSAGATGRRIVFALWGEQAQTLGPPLDAAVARLGVDPSLVVASRSGHPQVPNAYFADGNPLAAINAALGDAPIDWSLTGGTP